MKFNAGVIGERLNYSEYTNLSNRRAKTAHHISSIFIHMTPHFLTRTARQIIQTGTMFLDHMYRYGAVLKQYTATDRQWVVILLICAALLRFPFLSYPEQTVFDEPVYADFAMLSLQGHPFFDIHPPLARMFFATVVSLTDFDLTSATIITTPDFEPHPFQQFPYVPLRASIAFMGTLLPLLVYGISRLTKVSPRWAGLVGLLVALDPAFITYSRAILPDTMLLCLEMIGLLLAFRATQSFTSSSKMALAFCSALALGAAISVKWIALAIIGVVGCWYLFQRQWKLIVILCTTATITYLFIFGAFLSYFPNGGNADPVLVTYQVPYVTDLEFPKDPSLSERLNFIVEMHAIMWRANTDPVTSARLPDTPTALTWPLAKVSMLGWWSVDQGRSIMLKGNTLLYPLTFFLFFFELGWIATMIIRDKRWPIGKQETVLLIGYIANYLPFFFIGRSMFLYHYFTAFLFLLLLIPFVGPRMINCLSRVTRDRLFALVFSATVLLLIGNDLVTSMPQIYGF